ncbi:hypothetical protein J6590_107219, partial [Homalodisca vitripennis]
MDAEYVAIPVPKDKKKEYEGITIIFNRNRLSCVTCQSTKQWAKSFILGLYFYLMLIILYAISKSGITFSSILKVLITVVHYGLHVRVLLLSNVSVLDIVRVHALRDDENLGDKGELVPHADGAAALNLALRYLEQQATATPADIMFMTRWRNYA